jgi:putative inorganic carbon (hco3(-)) transporter
MILKSHTNRVQIYQSMVIVLSVVVVIGVAASGLFLSSNFSPVIVGSIPFLFVLLVIVFRKPAWAVFAAMIVVLLPVGLIPANIQSNLNRLLTIGALGVWCLYVIVNKRRIKLTSTGGFMLGFLLWSLITLFWAQNIMMSKDVLGSYTLRFILFLFLLPNVINTWNNLDEVMHSIAIAGWLFLITASITLFTQGYEVGRRFQILGGNENTLGGLFPIVMVGVIWLALRKSNPRRALRVFLSLAFLLLSFILIALNGSRGGAISWIVSMLVLLIWRQTRLWGLVGLFILLSAVISAPFILSTTIGRFLDLTQDSILGGREALWQAAWMLIRDDPLTGVGVGNSRSAMMSYVRLFTGVGNHEAVAIHNPILTIWVDTGLPGLLLYLGVLMSAIWSFIHQYNLSKLMGFRCLTPYYALITSAFFGYFATWIKGGGIESSFSYFLMVALLLIPSHLDVATDST